MDSVVVKLNYDLVISALLSLSLFLLLLLLLGEFSSFSFFFLSSVFVSCKDCGRLWYDHGMCHK